MSKFMYLRGGYIGVTHFENGEYSDDVECITGISPNTNICLEKNKIVKMINLNGEIEYWLGFEKLPCRNKEELDRTLKLKAFL